MLTRTPLAPSLGAMLLGALLAGCTTTRAPVHPAPPTASSQGKGIYKIGQPYQIDGTWYYPAEDFSYDETGIASWYGVAFHGKDTANGEVFDQNALTAAHRTLPLPSIVQVTNLENGRSVEVRVNDRGPFARGRIIDLSRRSAQLLGFEAQGTAKVRVKILVPESIQAASLARLNGSDTDGKVVVAAAPQAAPRIAVAAEPLAPLPGARVAPPAHPAPLPRPVPTPPAQLQLASAVATPLPEKVSVVPVRPTQIYIQVGAFAKPDNAWRLKGRLDPLGHVNVSGVRTNGMNVFRVRLGPIATVEEADQLLARVIQSGLPEARIVVD
ncbi:MAG TPA: septal ring lytic transglycosylase RlpA family protein [Stellaceae bacterium]|nr:septal ring lytic transglycosylase RlpA family protein [Stellaceae bacterium]